MVKFRISRLEILKPRDSQGKAYADVRRYKKNQR